jgi:peptidoglycan/LPS O-acetylase OafA/YrhL
VTQQIHNLTALRGAACLVVVFAHLHGWDVAFGVDTPVFREVRWVGVGCLDLFFVLSGFIITATNHRHFGRPAAVPGYLFRRVWRVYPTYWAAMALAAGTMWVFFGLQPFAADMLPKWPAWLALVPSTEGNFLISPAWTLVYEVVCYAVVGAVLGLPPRLAAAALAGWAAAVALAGAGRGPAGPWLANPWVGASLSPFVLEFLGGGLVAWLAGRGARGWWRTACVIGLTWATVGAVLVARGPEPYALALADQRLRVLVFGPPAVLIVYGLVAAEGRWRVPGWLRRTGDASYSLYLTHAQVMFAALYVGVRVPHTRVPHLLWLVGTFAAVLAVGFAFYALVERPLLNLGRRRRTPEAVVPPASAAVPLSRAA